MRALASIFFALYLLSPWRVWAAVPAPQAKVSPAYDAGTFVQELHRLSLELESARKSTEGLRSFRESLPKIWSVDAAGRHYEVPTAFLVSRLAIAESKPDLQGQQLNQARDYLEALAAEAASLSGQPAPLVDSARAKLDAILARSEYSRVHQESWWDKFRAYVNEILLNLLSRIFRGIGSQASFGYALLWIGISTAAILIAYWIFRRWFRAARAEEMDLQAAAVPARSWQEWVFAAREAAARNDYRIATHCAYWAGIARLQDLGALSPDRAKTPREYLRALAKSKLILPETLATRHHALSLLTSRMENIWYGYQIATEGDFRDSLTKLETLGCHLP